MNKEIKKQWVDALRSGKFKPGSNRLRRVDHNGDYCYCPLGVLAQLAVEAGGLSRA